MARFQRRGDHDALDALVGHYLGPALGVARELLGDRAAAEDAVQETFLRLVRKARQYDPARPFSPWFYAVLRNVCRDTLRRRGRERSALERRAATADCAAFPPEPPGRKLPALRLLDRLPEGERNVLRLRIVHDLSFRDVAAALDISREAAKKRAQRGLRRLRGLLRADRAS
jgi:RNA polymerase sigma-70 factor (ECF subfamily)